MIGKLLGGRYRLEHLLGEGGMGAVYEATNVAIGKRVAVKTVHPDKVVRPETIERFRREAFAMAAVESEHVAAILDAGDDPESGIAFFVMELLAGEDLSRLLQRVRALSPQAALRVAAQALEGLRAAHEAGVAHRDVKPANLFLVRRRDGARAVKLVDFGIARGLAGTDGPASFKVTKTGSVIGSPPYMSPEQFSALAPPDHRTDLWSLGVVLFELISGTNPYTLAPDFPQLMVRICFQPAPSLRDFAPGVPEEIVAIVQRAMTRDVNARYGSAAEMLADCKRLIQGSPELTDAMLAPAPVPQAQAQTVRMSVPGAGPPALSSTSLPAPYAAAASPPSAPAPLAPSPSAVPPWIPVSEPSARSGQTVPLSPVAAPSPPPLLLSPNPPPGLPAASAGRSPWMWAILVGVVAGAVAMALVATLGSPPKPADVAAPAEAAAGGSASRPTQTSGASAASASPSVQPAGEAPVTGNSAVPVSSTSAAAGATSTPPKAAVSTPPFPSTRGTAPPAKTTNPFGGQRGIGN